MYSCIKCDCVIYEVPRKLVCPKCGSELVDRAYYMNGEVYQGEKHMTIQLMLEYGKFRV